MKKLMVVALTLMVMLCFGAISFAGSLDDTGSPTSPNSAMFTLEDIYNRLGTGEAGTKRSGAFVEPSSGPTTGTGHTLDEVMGKAPSVDSANGAGAADVANGKTFWGLKGEEWGLKTGTDTIASDPAPVPKTGQTVTYATGDDGDLKKGVAWPDTRFTDNTDGTVTDNLTGLIWLKDADAFGSRNWADALTDCNTLNSGEHDLTDGSAEGDWRLPNVKELQSLIDWSQTSPALSSGHPFSGVQSSYWSSTTYAAYSVYAWFVYLSNGYNNLVDKGNVYDVWPVRGGQ